MGLRLTPKSTGFYPLFNAAGEHVRSSGLLLSRAIAAAPDERPAIAVELKAVENAADETVHETLRMVNSTFVTPFDREDIYRLASSLDDVVDDIEAAVDLIVLYGIRELPSDFDDFAEVLQLGCERTALAMPQLQGLAEMAEYWIEINRLENQADQIHRRLLARLFSGEFETLDVLRLKDIADALEAAADSLEKVAHTVESIAVKES